MNEWFGIRGKSPSMTTMGWTDYGEIKVDGLGENGMDGLW